MGRIGLMGGGISSLDDAGFVEEVDDLAGEALELVVEVVGEEIDPLVRALDAAANFGEVFGLLVAQLVEFDPRLAQKFFELLFERGTALEMVDDLEEDEEGGRERRGVDEPRGEMHRVGRGQFLREDRGEEEGKEVAEVGEHLWIRRR